MLNDWAHQRAIELCEEIWIKHKPVVHSMAVAFRSVREQVLAEKAKPAKRIKRENVR